jgi:hypothetical protein
MPTILHRLDEKPEDRRLLHDLCLGIFLEGECYAFAIALHQGLGWPMVGLMMNGTIWHAGVRNPFGGIRDVRGNLSEEEFCGHFGGLPSEIREIDIKELYAQRPISDLSILRARRCAELLWPDIEWRTTTYLRVCAFAEELESLSRKYGFWIASAVPTATPLLFKGHGDEGGYEVRPTVDGTAHTINRYLK